MDEQDAVAEENRSAQLGLNLSVDGMSLEPVRDEQEVGELAFVERFRARLRFELSDSAGSQASLDELPCYLQILAYNLATEQAEVLASTRQRLQAGQSDYTFAVEFAAPKIGRYKLLGTVLLPDGNAVGVALGPVLHMIPE